MMTSPPSVLKKPSPFQSTFVPYSKLLPKEPLRLTGGADKPPTNQREEELRVILEMGDKRRSNVMVANMIA
jgi:hypothetical protein